MDESSPGRHIGGHGDLIVTDLQHVGQHTKSRVEVPQRPGFCLFACCNSDKIKLAPPEFLNLGDLP
jgi:hypothetical protein